MIVFLVVVAVIWLFGFVIIFGAPYLPTLRPQTKQALDMLDLKPGQTLLELGSGDGRVLKAAAQRGLKVVGYELNPILVLVSLLITWRYRKQVRVVWGNFWRKEFPPSDGAFVFLLDRFMVRLDRKFKNSAHPPKKVISFAFKIPDKKIAKTHKGLYLYEYS
jgi:SAM-dependent methyltransferase